MLGMTYGWEIFVETLIPESMPFFRQGQKNFGISGDKVELINLFRYKFQGFVVSVGMRWVNLTCPP
jgi:hypothetical protein